MVSAKKGVSAVVATVLIIMITVAAVAIIWSTVIPMIKNSASQGINCYEAESNLQIMKGAYTCANSTISRVQVSRGSGDANITGINIQWISDGESVSVTNSTTPDVNGMLVYTNSTSYDEVSIAPIITVGDVETVCAASLPISLPAC